MHIGQYNINIKVQAAMAINKQVIDLLKNKVASAPRTEELHLDFMHINDLIPYMDLLAQLKNLKKLSLYGNRLKQLPIDMSSLQSLEELDISNNLLNDVQMVVVSLKTIKNLRTLKYPLKKEKQSVVIESITTLNALNDLKIIRQPAKKPLPLKYMKDKSLQEFKQAMIFHFRKVKHFQQTNLDQKLADNSEQRFANELQAVIKQSMKVLIQKQGEMTQTLQIVYFNKTKYDIFQLLKNRCVNMATDIYGDLGKLIKQIWDTQNNIFNSIFKQTVNLLHFQYEINEIERQKKQDNNIGMQQKMYARNDHLEKQIRRIKKQKDQLVIQNNQLEAENKRYLQSLVRYAKGDKSGFINIQNSIPLKQSNNQSFSQNFAPIQPLKSSGGAKPSPVVKQSMTNYNYMSNTRNLTLKALKDTIQQIYESKQKFDQKNFDGKIPRETMHQYLFTHLNQKYGLKNLTIQAASSIVGGIQTYSAQDNDVAVFGKILKNQIDQQFRNVQVELKTTINSLLKTYIKSQVPYKSAGQIQKLFNDKINGDISSEEIQEIIKYLYSKIDSDRILHKMDLLYRLNKPKQQPTNRRHMRDESLSNDKQKKKLKFSIFLQTVLDFQLKNHERHLRPLVSIFKSRDRDSDGIVNEQQFISIIEQLCEEATDIIPDMLMIVDPYQTRSITFTQTVRLLANYPESNPILNRFIQKQQVQYDIE